MSLQITRVHPHGLARQTTVLSGHWCNQCRQTITSESYRCSSCDFDICSLCLGKSKSTVATRVHVHPLTYTTTGLTSHYCDLCSLAVSRDAWRCSTCNFDVCTSCFEGTQVVLPPKPVVPPTEVKASVAKHAHALHAITGAAAHYCDGCKKSVAGVACHRCDPCNFEYCDACYKASASESTRYHVHPLTYTTSGLANHYCDVCRVPTTTESWRCAIDNFDLCGTCFERSRAPKPSTPTPATPAPVETKIHAHALVRTTTGLSGKYCDGCRATPLTVSYRCTADNYDLCTACYDRTYKRVVSLHPHALTHTTENVSTHYCDVCRGTIGSGAAFRCNGCDWDCCNACVERLTAPKPTPPTPTPVVEDKEPIMTKAHAHPLVRTTTGLANHFCDGCRATNLTVAYRCEKDNFDLCPTCMNRNRSSQVTRMHAHPLIFTRGLVNHYCDDCRKPVSASWRCAADNFDLCGVCFVRAKMTKPRPVAPVAPVAPVVPAVPTPAGPVTVTPSEGIAVKTHAHVLTRNTGSLVGHYCDQCNASPLTEAYSCKDCNYDNCTKCLDANRVQQSSRLHVHPMTWTTGLSSHYCDVCRRTTEASFRCASCNYDVCNACFDTTRIVSAMPVPSAPVAAPVPVAVASPAVPPPTAPAPTTFWSCTACTYINVASANECYICGNGKS